MEEELTEDRDRWSGEEKRGEGRTIKTNSN
jgi:hypothetical protein